MLSAVDLLNQIRQGGSQLQRPMPQQPMPNPQMQDRVPLQFGGETIPPDHPLYDVIKRIILEKYQGPQGPMGSQG